MSARTLDSCIRASSAFYISSDDTFMMKSKSAAAVSALCEQALDMIITMASSSSSSLPHIVLLDKNHSIETVWKSRHAFTSSNLVHVKTVVLSLDEDKFVSDPLQRPNFSPRWPYAFSAGYFLTCLTRVLQRPDHPTINSKDLKERVLVVLNHLKYHKRMEPPTLAFDGIPGFSVLSIRTVQGRNLLREDFANLSSATYRGNSEALLDLVQQKMDTATNKVFPGETAPALETNQLLGVCHSDLTDLLLDRAVTKTLKKLQSVASFVRYPRYYGIALSSHTNFFKGLLSTAGFAPSSVTWVGEAHCTMLYLDGRSPETVLDAERADYFRIGCNVRQVYELEIDSVAYSLHPPLACLSVKSARSNLASVFPSHAHITLAYGRGLKAMHSRELLVLIEGLLSSSAPKEREESNLGILKTFDDLSGYVGGHTIRQVYVFSPTERLTVSGLITCYWH